MPDALTATRSNNEIIMALFRGNNRALAGSMVEIVTDLRDYWPLTVRQVFYQFVQKLILPNTKANYQKVSRISVILRRHDVLPWHCIADRTRRTIGKRGIRNVSEFIEEQMESFLNPSWYQRCYIQDQDVYVEMATEKDALSGILTEAIWYHCTRLNVVRGQVSATMVNAMAERFEKAAYLGKRCVLAFFGDLDPTGSAIPKALIRNMDQWHGVDVDLVRVALNPDQVIEHDLPQDFDAIKPDDPNLGAWLRDYGPEQAPVELDALHPELLTKLAQDALNDIYDTTEMDEQRAVEAKERRALKLMKQRIQDVMNQDFGAIIYPDDDFDIDDFLAELGEE